MKKHKPPVIEEVFCQIVLSDGELISKTFTGRKLEKILESNAVFKKLVDEV